MGAPTTESTSNPDFNRAAEEVRQLKTEPSNNDLLTLYSLFKQSTVGDCNTSRPGMLDLKGKAKWDSWSGIKGIAFYYPHIFIGKAKETAQKEYVEFVESLKSKYNK